MSDKKVEYEKIEKVTKDADEEVKDTEVEKPELEPLVDVQPKKYKKGLMERLVVAVIGPDGLPSIGRRVNHEIIVPAVKDMLYETLTTGLHMAVFKGQDTGRGSSKHTGSRNSVYESSRQAAPTQYTNRYRSANTQRTTVTREPEPSDMYRRNGGYVDQYLIKDRGVAQDILNAMLDRLSTYKQVSVADYYQMMEVPSVWTDSDIGWTDLRSARIGVVRGGYVLELPRVEAL